MKAMWAGRFQKELSAEVNDFNSSIPFDARMYRQDIAGSLAHAAMLAAQGILTKQEAAAIAEGLAAIREELDSGALAIDPEAEDIHMFVEAELTRRIGDAGKKLHTARSRNDQVALDLRLYLLSEAGELRGLTRRLLGTVLAQAEAHAETILPGYTHLQRAQPVTFGHHLMAYANMFCRDLDRLSDWEKRARVSPLGQLRPGGDDVPHRPAGHGGGAGPCRRVRKQHGRRVRPGFRAGAGRVPRGGDDAPVPLCRGGRALVLVGVPLCGAGRRLRHRSSIMPQKKNPDIAELVRGKAGRAFGDLMALLTVMKGLPLAYNKDMQEDKEAIFDSVDTVRQCLSVFEPMLATMRVRADNMRRAASAGFINATDCADYLTAKGVPFRTAYRVTGELVAHCIAAGTTLEALPLADYRRFSDVFDEGVYAAIDLDACVRRRQSFGGTSPASVRAQIAAMRERLSL